MNEPLHMQAAPIKSDKRPIQPLAVEMLISPDQRRTSRTAHDEIDAVNQELQRIESNRKSPT
jgi:hypothetical protein